MMLVAVSYDEIESFAIARQHIFNRRDQRGEPAEEDLYEILGRGAQAFSRSGRCARCDFLPRCRPRGWSAAIGCAA